MMIKRVLPRRRKLIHIFDLIIVLVSRDLKLLYKRSFLGVVWTLLNPLVQLAVFSFMFRVILKVDIPHYTSYSFSGLLIWSWTRSSLIQATGTIVNNRPLLQQPGFPVGILPVVTVATGLTHLLIAFPALLLFLYLDGVELTPMIGLLPAILVIQFGLTTGLAYPLAALNVTFRDTQHTADVLLQLMNYMLPIFYSISQVPEEIRTVYSLNPMVSVLGAYRSILFEGQAPDWSSLLGMSLIAVLLLPLGYRLFRQQSDFFLEEA